MPENQNSVYFYVLKLKSLSTELIQQKLADNFCRVKIIGDAIWPDVEQNAVRATGYYNITEPHPLQNCSTAFTSVLIMLANIPSTIDVNTTLTPNTTQDNNWTSTVQLSIKPTKTMSVVLYIIIGVITAVALIITIVLIVSLNRGKKEDGYSPVVEEIDDDKYRDDPY
jgi:hypothetical protein